MLEEAAAIAEERAGDGARAFQWLCEALPLAGGSLALEREVLRLAETTGGHARAADALAALAASAADTLPPLPLAHVHERRGTLLEEKVGDLVGARRSYEAALALTPERLGPRRRLLSVMVRLRELPAAAALMVEPAVSPATRATVLMPLYESLAREAGTLPAAAAALAQAAEKSDGVDLEPRARGASCTRASPPRSSPTVRTPPPPTRRWRGRSAPSRGTSRRCGSARSCNAPAATVGWSRRCSGSAAEQPNDLEVLREAAAVALAKSDEPLALELLAQLAERATRLAHTRAGGPGRRGRGRGRGARRRRERAAERGARRGRAHQARDLAAGRRRAAPGRRRDPPRLAAPRRRAQRDGPRRRGGRDPDSGGRCTKRRRPTKAAREALARLYEGERRFADATALRLAELEATSGSERRLSLRLEIVRVGGLLEQRSNAADVLRANLAERPGHAETVTRLAEVLLAKGQAR